MKNARRERQDNTGALALLAGNSVAEVKALSFRHAVPADADAIVALIRRSFRPQDLSLTIYACTGVVEYLRDRISHSDNRAETTMLVSESDQAVIGFIDLARKPSGLFLNYIAVAEAFQRHGVGRSLICHALASTDAPQRAVLMLDVFQHNQRAVSWYAAMGFTKTGSSAFWQVHVKLPAKSASELAIVNVPQSDSFHKTYGFSTITVSHRERHFTAGRLGDRWLRVSDPVLLARPDLMAGLIALEPARQLLINANAADLMHEDLDKKLLLQVDRLQACLPLNL